MLDAYDAEHTIRHLDDDSRFPATVTDVDLVKALSADDPKPIFVTADVNMYSRRADERHALANSGLTCVFFKKGFNSLIFHTQAVKLPSIWPDIVRETGRCSEPTAFEISPAARKLQRLCPTRQL